MRDDWRMFIDIFLFSVLLFEPRRVLTLCVKRHIRLGGIEAMECLQNSGFAGFILPDNTSHIRLNRNRLGIQDIFEMVISTRNNFTVTSPLAPSTSACRALAHKSVDFCEDQKQNARRALCILKLLPKNFQRPFSLRPPVRGPG
jgi:hypothetical protein